jgi:hypothetical protein
MHPSGNWICDRKISASSESLEKAPRYGSTFCKDLEVLSPWYPWFSKSESPLSGSAAIRREIASYRAGRFPRIPFQEIVPRRNPRTVRSEIRTLKVPIAVPDFFGRCKGGFHRLATGGYGLNRSHRLPSGGGARGRLPPSGDRWLRAES